MNNLYDDEKFYEEYANMPRSKQGLEAAGEWHQLKNLFPDMKGKTLLDLGCGYGWHCAYAIKQGAAHADGIDLSENMIKEAKVRNADERIDYKVCGLDEFAYPDEHYDVAVSNLVLHYIEDLEEIYHKVHKTLKKDGIFLFNIEHPVFTSGVKEDWIYDENQKPLYWPIDDYYKPGERETIFLGQVVKKQHHTLTQILMGLLSCGFVIEAIEEAMPSEDMMDIPGMADELRRPMMLLVKARKQ